MSLLLAALAGQAVDPYVRLASSLPADQWNALETYVGERTRGGPIEGQEAAKPPAFVLPGASPLAAQKASVERWASILSGLRQISDLPYEPGAGRNDEGYTGVKRLEKFVFYAAHVRFAEGRRREAVTILLDGLTMARRFRGGSTLDALVGVACESIVMSGFEEHLNQIPLAECDRVRKAADGYLALGTPTPSDALPVVRAALADAPPRWVFKDADPMLPAFAKGLTQMRLLRLHMRIEAYRWQNLKLPVRLQDAAPEEETVDPLVQEPYRYERTETSYRLTSAGFPGQGPMGLRYRRAPNFREPDESNGGRP